MDMIPRNDYGERCQFDAYCKLVLYHEAIDYLREMQRRRDRELSFSDLPQMEIVNVGFVDVGRNDESVFSLCPSHRCFIADLVRFFRGDFSRLKGLAYLVCDDIVLLLSAGNMLILPFGKQKFLICCLWITLIGTDKFAIIGFCGIL